MNDQFDELAKGMAQSVTRRGALKKFGVGLAGLVLASLGFADQARAGHGHVSGQCRKACNQCKYPYGCDALPLSEQQGCFYYCNGCCSLQG